MTLRMQHVQIFLKAKLAVSLKNTVGFQFMFHVNYSQATPVHSFQTK